MYVWVYKNGDLWVYKIDSVAPFKNLRNDGYHSWQIHSLSKWSIHVCLEPYNINWVGGNTIVLLLKVMYVCIIAYEWLNDETNELNSFIY